MTEPSRELRTLESAVLEDSERSERRVQAVRMHSLGVPVRKIAETLRIPLREVRAEIAAGLAEIRSETIEDVIARQRLLYRDILRAQYPQLIAGDADAARVAMAAAAGESKLVGADAPIRVHVGVGEVEFNRRISEMLHEIAGHTPMEVDDLLNAHTTRAGTQPLAMDDGVETDILADDYREDGTL